ncbi:MAG: hypothetical protein ABF979_05610 [Gluconobacter sp.]|uniref:hypothetical protein n=1 Tax=Gluconobacter sp. TaxID=1876758 RepID=UPI0039E8BE64
MRASGYERQKHNWYVEESWVVDAMLQAERPFQGRVMDPCCGGGTIPDTLVKHPSGASVQECLGADLIDRSNGRFRIGDYGITLAALKPDSVISNPPYGGEEKEFIETALAHTTDRVVVILRLAFLEGQKKKVWFEGKGLARVWVSSRRVSMPPGGLGVKAKNGSTAYAWFVFEHGYTGAYPALGLI